MVAIVAEAPAANNETGSVIHRFNTHESWVFHIIHRLRKNIARARHAIVAGKRYPYGCPHVRSRAPVSFNPVAPRVTPSFSLRQRGGNGAQAATRRVDNG